MARLGPLVCRQGALDEHSLALQIECMVQLILVFFSHREHIPLAPSRLPLLKFSLSQLELRGPAKDQSFTL